LQWHATQPISRTLTSRLLVRLGPLGGGFGLALGLLLLLLGSRQILLRVYGKQRFDGGLGLLENGVGTRIADPFRLVAGERGEQDEHDGDQQKPARQPKNEAQGAVQ